MQRCLHLVIGGRDYAAFGNLFLLRWARKVQVFCHRKARYGQLTEEERLRYGYLHGGHHTGIMTTRGSDTGHTTTRSYDAGFMTTRSSDDGHTTTRSYDAGIMTTRGFDAGFVTSVAYETTEAYRQQCREWKRLLMEGQTVMVTPGISMGERIIKDRCLESGYPLIHIQREPIGSRWKPEQTRFEACVRGNLLILAPWKPEQMGDVNGVPTDTDYAVFHNLNRVAEEICGFIGDARVIGLD